MSIDQLTVLIEVGENLLPTVYLPELDQLKVELVRSQRVMDDFNKVSVRAHGVTDEHLTSLIFESETLVVDMNKSIW